MRVNMVNNKTVLIVYGSPHSDGPTSRITAAFESALPDGLSAGRFDCFARMPKPCTDCRACRTDIRCAFDDIGDYYSMIENAGALVFCAPVYNLSFPAPMKAVIDRGQVYWSQRFVRGISFDDRLEGSTRRPAVLITAAGRDSGEMLRRQLLPALTVMGARLISHVHYTGADEGADIEPALALARSAAAGMARDLYNQST